MGEGKGREQWLKTSPLSLSDNGMCSFPVQFWAHQKAIPEMSIGVRIVYLGGSSRKAW